MGDDGRLEALTIEDVTIKIKHVKDAVNQIKASMAAQQDNLAEQLDQTMFNMVAKQMQVAEVYSPPRVVEMT